MSRQDSFFSTPLIESLRGLTAPSPVGFAYSQSPFATSQSSSGASYPPEEGIQNPFSGLSWLDLVGRNYSKVPQFPADVYDPLKVAPIKPRPPRQPFTTNSASISQADAIAKSNSNMSPEEQAFYRDYMARMNGTAAPAPSLQPQRLGLTTPYGMVYPTRHQLGQAQQLSESRPMSSRLANVGEKVVRPKVLKSRIDYVKENTTPDDGSTMRKALEGLTQAEKIRVMKERGKQLAKQRKEDTEKFFASKQSERREETEAIQKSSDTAIGKTKGGGQTRQRSWSNYTGKAPIRNFDYENA
jgi:hypothetical protein